MSHHFLSDDEDVLFFRRAMKDVKRIKRSPDLQQNATQKKHLTNLPCKSSAESEKSQPLGKGLLQTLSDPLEQTIGAEDKLFFKRPGPQNKVIKQLMRGEINRSACIDLHGMTIEQARSAVIDFFIMCLSSHFRCVQVIHGKGQSSANGPKLKNYVNYWLPQIAWVLAFTSAQPKDGGKGSVYVLLAKSSAFNL